MVSVLTAGLMSMASCPLPADEALEVPTLLDDEEDELTVVLLFGNFFLGFSVLAAWALSRLSTESCNSLASLLHSSRFAFMLSRRALAEGLITALGVDLF